MSRIPEVGILVGSSSDLEPVRQVFGTLDEFQVGYEVAIISAHRTPGLLCEYASSAAKRGIKVIIAAAGLSAALAGAIAALVDIPVIGLPVSAGALKGIDALLSTAQMPPGVPVAAVGIDGARNAGLLALRILGLGSREIASRLFAYRQSQARETEQKSDAVLAKGLPGWDRS